MKGSEVCFRANVEQEGNDVGIGLVAVAQVSEGVIDSQGTQAEADAEGRTEG